ncbi:MAG: hypothetical protein KKE11_01580, partial [Gammaproteobacteria bacterium]|nr:hypothetical protein [Gammaproteobacteria bacterium]
MSINKLAILLVWVVISMFFNSNIFGQSLSCEQITKDQQLCAEIGQMLIIGFGGFKQEESGKVLWDDKDGVQFNKKSLIARHIADDHIGGVILFQKSPRDLNTQKFIRDRNIQGPKQVAQLNSALQTYNAVIRQKQKLDSLPLFIGVDQEGGRIDRLPAAQGFPVATLVPQAFGAKEEIAAKKDDALNETYAYAKKMAEELSSLHFNLNFFPTVDVNINPANPIIGGMGRSFSSNPDVVFDQAKQFVRAFHDHGIIAALKHFPGHGSSAGDSHLGLVDVTETYQKDRELFPYLGFIKDGYDDMIMTTHVINGQIDQTQCKAGLVTDHTTWCPGTMSKLALTELLRDKMGFNGIIVSDDMTMGAITLEYTLSESLKNSINAGVDMFIVANNYEDQTNEVINAIAQLVKDGDIKRERIGESYKRISDFKKKRLPSMASDVSGQDPNFIKWIISKILGRPSS